MSCVFCDIVNGIIPAKIIATSEHAIAFLDVSPVSDGHTLVITKKHYKCFSETPDEVLADVTLLAKKVANLIDGTLKP
jgi:histidine triad (HIT) family protein